ncbi:MAG: YraN family protein [Bacillota bacterium]
MSEKRQKVGLAGEDAARDYLLNKGYEILATNYRCPLGEIDIIARDNRTIVIVEVRTKTGYSFGGPEESITAAKAKKLNRLAMYYLRTISCRDIPCRIDLVAVMLNRNNFLPQKINHIQGILAG